MPRPMTMPRMHKNKYHACVKCHQVQGDTQCPQEAQTSAAAAPKEEFPSSPSSFPQASPLSSLPTSFNGNYTAP